VGESVEDFVVESGSEWAEMVLADRTHFSLDHEAWDASAAPLDRPPEAKPQLLRLFRRPRPQ
jgi:uncharacterized protein (DUF1778 family)